MAQSMGGFISGNPEAMLSFVAEGPDPGGLGGKPSFTLDGMAESGAFAEAHGRATDLLMRFITAANEGFQSYTTVARASGGTYLNADEAGRATISGVTMGYVR